MLAEIKDFVPLATPLVAAAVALFTVRYTARTFYRQRWWERKADAYSNIIEAVHEMADHFSTQVQFEVIAQDLEEDVLPGGLQQNSERVESFRAANKLVSKAAGVGAYIISPRAAEVLHRLANAHESATGDTIDKIYEHYAAVASKALVELREIAKQDLGVN